MPRGDNPKSRANLKHLTSEEAREFGTKGGKASGESRRALKTFQQIDSECTSTEERQKMLEALKKRALQGNIKAWEIYAHYMGMKPTDKIMIAEVDVDVISDVEKIMLEDDDD